MVGSSLLSYKVSCHFYEENTPKDTLNTCDQYALTPSCNRLSNSNNNNINQIICLEELKMYYVINEASLL